MKFIECDFCDSTIWDHEHWVIKGTDYKFCTRLCAENKAKSLLRNGEKYKLEHVR